MNCLVGRQMNKINDYEDEELKAKYMKNVLSIIAEADEKETAPEIYAQLNQLQQQYFGTSDDFRELKIKYNKLILQKEEAVWNRIQAAGDNLLEALKYSSLGNYIDFGAMSSVDDDKLNSLLDSVSDDFVQEALYRTFQNDLKNAGKLVYLTDNCGEVVFDKLFIKCIKHIFPQLHITVIVKGAMILNDATMEDAEMVGLTEVAEVIDNGAGIAGTCLNKINQKSRDLIMQADLIIAKGQGNFETLNGCGLNIYYIFLCKCKWFVKQFGLEQFKGVFMNDKSIKH